MNKICKKCSLNKDILEFASRGGKNKHLYITICKDCKNIYDKEYRDKNKIERNNNSKKYYENNKIELLQIQKEYRKNNIETIHEKEIEYRKNNPETLSASRKKYYYKNKEKIIKRNQEYRQNSNLMIEYVKTYSSNREKIDSNFKLRRRFSSSIYLALKKNGGSKQGFSCMKYIEYSIQELKDHLEKQFEPWMNWGNHGVLKGWNDNDQTTWTWQIDHIYPQSLLPYSSMEDDNFKKCWALDNLRPLSSKQNIKKSDKIQ